jgi:hypothetical protein
MKKQTNLQFDFYFIDDINKYNNLNFHSGKQVGLVISNGNDSKRIKTS